MVCLRFDDSYIATAGGFARGEDGEEILGVDSSVRLWDIRTMRCIQNLEQTPPSEPHNIDGDPVLSLDLKPSMLVSVRAMRNLVIVRFCCVSAWLTVHSFLLRDYLLRGHRCVCLGVCCRTAHRRTPIKRYGCGIRGRTSSDQSGDGRDCMDLAATGRRRSSQRLQCPVRTIRHSEPLRIVSLHPEDGIDCHTGMCYGY
eukprot:SAG11_NODE_222_length_12140_cov_26.886554_4_plen_199_part_00